LKGESILARRWQFCEGLCGLSALDFLFGLVTQAGGLGWYDGAPLALWLGFAFLGRCPRLG
jgi:hypothetical protein